MKKFLVVSVIALACVSCGHIAPVSKYPNMVADLDPYSIGMARVSFDRFFSSDVKENEVDVIFYPRENVVALEFRRETIRYRQFWNETDRGLFIDALNLYKADFAGKNLVDKYRQTRAAYGKFAGKIEWETFKFTMTYHASPVMELGYRFRGDTPYFSVLQRSARENSGANNGANLESLQFSLYFSRSQGDELAGLFAQEFLLGTLGDRVVPVSDDSADDVYIVE